MDLEPAEKIVTETVDLQPTSPSAEASPAGFMLDLVLYLSVMFLIREVWFSEIGFIANGLFWSFTTLVVATWRMTARGIRWKDLGLRRPENLPISAAATVFILVMSIGSIVVFQILQDQIPLGLAPDQSDEQATRKFGDLYGNWPLFFAIIPFVWLQSMLEEMLDRAFLITWIEKVFSSPKWATVLAVVLQATIFGFRHSYDLSERSITVGLIGLAMGIGYVAFGRNLWPPIIAHCVLNTMSMLDRVT